MSPRASSHGHGHQEVFEPAREQKFLTYKNEGFTPRPLQKRQKWRKWWVLPRPKHGLSKKIIYLSLDEHVSLSLRGVKWTPDPNSFEKYPDTHLISIAMLLQKFALILGESSMYTASRYASYLHRTYFAEASWSGVLGTPLINFPLLKRQKAQGLSLPKVHSQLWQTPKSPENSVFLDSLMWENKRKECHPSRGVFFCRMSMGQDFVDALFGNRPGN